MGGQGGGDGNRGGKTTRVVVRGPINAAIKLKGKHWKSRGGGGLDGMIQPQFTVAVP